MPELPEVEFARRVVEGGGLRRRIVDVDDSDSYVCRPHAPGEIKGVLVGRELTGVHRRGKSLWCDTGGDGPELGVHLGMSGKIVVADARGNETDGGDYWRRGREPGDHRFARFSVGFSDGGWLMLVDPRRLGRVRLDPPVDELGPDAEGVGAAEFRTRVLTGAVPVKARLLDQRAVAGIGNLMADEILWDARIHPARRAGELSRAEGERLLRAVHRAVRDALRGGGVHTLAVVPYRKDGARCPRDDAPMTHGKVGGRTTWWCAKEQTAD